MKKDKNTVLMTDILAMKTKEFEEMKEKKEELVRELNALRES